MLIVESSACSTLQHFVTSATDSDAPIVTAGFTLARRHLKTEGYAIETVEMLRRDVL
jgi:hypothetical protein